MGAGEVVLIWGGTAWAELEAGEVPPCSFSFVDDDVLLAGPADGLDYFVNHSCDPSVSCRTRSRSSLAATSEPAARSRATTRSGRPRTPTSSTCTCGGDTCRGVIRGSDWQLPELQQRYAGHFLPYIGRRFRQSV